MVVLGIIVGLLVLSVLVALHELGHALAARKNGVIIEEYAIGFPPRLWAKKLKSGILFAINALPIGGYVKLRGEYDSASEKGDYGASGYKAKTKILFAGVATNFLLAWLVLSILSVTGLPVALPNQFRFADDTVIKSAVTIAALEKDGPAARAGLLDGDEIVSLAGEEIASPVALIKATQARAGENVPIVVRRANELKTFSVSIRDKDKSASQGFTGIYPTQKTWTRTSLYRAPASGLVVTAQFSWETLKGVGQLIGNFFGGLFQKLSPDENIRQLGEQNLAKASGSVAGPIGMLGTIFPALLSSDITTFFFFVALISLTLAVMNLLPIPGLDGGRWLLMTIFKLCKKPLDEELESKIQGIGMMVLFGIMILVVISDVSKIIK